MTRPRTWAQRSCLSSCWNQHLRPRQNRNCNGLHMCLLIGFASKFIVLHIRCMFNLIVSFAPYRFAGALMVASKAFFVGLTSSKLLPCFSFALALTNCNNVFQRRVQDMFQRNRQVCCPWPGDIKGKARVEWLSSSQWATPHGHGFCQKALSFLLSFCYRFSVVTRKPLPGLNAPSHGCEQEGRKGSKQD